MVENQNHDRTNNSDQDAVEIYAAYPEVANAVEEPATYNGADDS